MFLFVKLLVIDLRNQKIIYRLQKIQTDNGYIPQNNRSDILTTIKFVTAICKTRNEVPIDIVGMYDETLKKTHWLEPEPDYALAVKEDIQ